MFKICSFSHQAEPAKPEGKAEKKFKQDCYRHANKNAKRNLIGMYMQKMP
jgi:hypothetical protein